MRNRRGLSSMVGAVFFIIAMTVAIGYISFSMDTLDEFAQTIIVKAAVKEDQSNEEFQINKVTIDGNLFNVTVTNTGQIPIKIIRLWVEDVTSGVSAGDAVPKSCSINKQVGPLQTAIKIGQSCSITASDTGSYKMKFVTERGKIKEFSVNFVGSEPIDLQLLVLPTTLPSEFTTTVLFVVKNNMTSNNILTNLVPNLSTSVGGAGANLLSGPNPPQYDTLTKGETAIFKWIFKMTGETGDTKTFTASLQNGYPENQVSEDATISDVIFAIQSGASIETQGITVPPTPDNILMLHQETGDALDGRQMAPTNPDTAGFSIDTGVSTTSIFYSNNDTAVIVPAGNWDASLRYISKSLPDSISTSADMIFHFEDLDDSSGNGNLLSVNGAQLVSPCDKDGAACFTFDGINDYLSISNSNDNDIGTQDDSTAGWFKTPTSSSKQIIFRTEGGDFYEIFVNSVGKVVFQFDSGAGAVSCTSVDPYDNDAWHFFVAVRAAGQQCELYMDDKPAVLVSNSGGGNQNVNVSSDVFIGIAPDLSDPFAGSIGYVMHWNSFALSSQNVLDLFNSDYGPNAHQMTFTYEETDKDGVVLGAPLKQDNNYVIPFHDAKGDPTAWATNFDYTTSIQSVTIDANNRLKFTFTWNSGLHMIIRIDDSNLDNPKSSFIQMPMPDTPFPAYYTYSISQFPKVNVYNTGPYGSWLTFLTRITFDDINSDNSFSAHIFKVDGVELKNGIQTDSILLKVDQTYEVEFHKPRSVPDSTNQGAGNAIPIGQYKLYTFFSGHDEQGNIFLRTVYLGPVKVTD